MKHASKKVAIALAGALAAAASSNALAAGWDQANEGMPDPAPASDMLMPGVERGPFVTEMPLTPPEFVVENAAHFDQAQSQLTTILSDADYSFQLISSEIAYMKRPDLQARLDEIYDKAQAAMEMAEADMAPFSDQPAFLIGYLQDVTGIVECLQAEFQELVDSDPSLKTATEAADRFTVAVRNEGVAEEWGLAEFRDSMAAALQSLRPLLDGLKGLAAEGGFLQEANASQPVPSAPRFDIA